jgi:hypothetical protein
MDDERLAEMDQWVKDGRVWYTHQVGELLNGYKEIAEQLRKTHYGPVPTPAPTECICPDEGPDYKCPQHWRDAFPSGPEPDPQKGAIEGLRTAGWGTLANVLEASLRLSKVPEEGEDECECRRYDEALMDAMDRLAAAHEKIDSLKTKLRRSKRKHAAKLRTESAISPTSNRQPKPGDRVKVEIIGTYRAHQSSPGCTPALHILEVSTGGTYHFYSPDTGTFTVLEPADA